VGAASGAVLVALVLAGHWEAAVLHADDLNPQVGRYAYDEGNASFANSWVALASFAVCCGWVIITTTGILPRWLSGWAVISGVRLALSAPTGRARSGCCPTGSSGYGVVIVSMLLLRRSADRDAEPG
jgi:hypothetical protein